MISRVDNLSQVHSAFDAIRCRDSRYVSNFFSSDLISSLLRDGNKVHLFEGSHVAAVFAEARSFMRLWFIAETDGCISEIAGALADFGGLTVTDLVGNEVALASQIEALIAIGMTKYRRLDRLVLEGAPNVDPRCPVDLRSGAASDIDSVLLELGLNFDELADQIPSRLELNDIVNREELLVATTDDQLIGFLVFRPRGRVTDIKYWCVRGSHRGQGVGSALMHEALKVRSARERTLLWVSSDNIEAIKRYQHYGFHREGLVDQVMVWGVGNA